MEVQNKHFVRDTKLPQVKDLPIISVTVDSVVPNSNHNSGNKTSVKDLVCDRNQDDDDKSIKNLEEDENIEIEDLEEGQLSDECLEVDNGEVEKIGRKMNLGASSVARAKCVGVEPRIIKTVVSSKDRQTLTKYLLRGARFFAAQTSSMENVKLAKKYNVWATTTANELKLNKAFTSTRNVIILIFVKHVDCILGFARISALSHCNNIKWITPKTVNVHAAFEIDWISKKKLPFEEMEDFINPWVKNKSVSKSKDGEEFETHLGEKLCEMFEHDESCRLCPIIKKSKACAANLKISTTVSPAFEYDLRHKIESRPLHKVLPVPEPLLKAAETRYETFHENVSPFRGQRRNFGQARRNNRYRSRQLFQADRFQHTRVSEARVVNNTPFQYERGKSSVVNNRAYYSYREEYENISKYSNKGMAQHLPTSYQSYEEYQNISVEYKHSYRDRSPVRPYRSARHFPDRQSSTSSYYHRETMRFEHQDTRRRNHTDRQYHGTEHQKRYRKY